MDIEESDNYRNSWFQKVSEPSSLPRSRFKNSATTSLGLWYWPCLKQWRSRVRSYSI